MPLVLEIAAGATFKLSFWVKNEDKSAVDLTGCSAWMQLRRQYSSPTPALSLTSSPAAGLTITPLAGRVDIEISDAQTRALSLSTVNDAYVYECKVVFPSGEVRRALEGRALVSPEAAKP